MQSLRDNQPDSRKRGEHLSKDGKWRSFPKVPHRLQYVISGNCFGKVKIIGGTVPLSLQTTAQLKLNGFLKAQRENRNKIDPPKFSEAVELFDNELADDSTMKPRGKERRVDCITKLQRTCVIGSRHII